MKTRVGSTRSLVLAGAVAKGAFEAGAVTVLAKHGVAFDRFVGTSAGALNAALLAVGAAAGRFEVAADALETLWRDDAGFGSFFQPTLSSWWGLSKTGRVERLVENALERVAGGVTKPKRPQCELTIVTTDVAGAKRDGERTHEGTYAFNAVELLDPAKRRAIAKAATASAAFPVLFVPPILDEKQRVDGGLVNNAPISYAIDTSVAENRIVVISAETAEIRPRERLALPRLLARLVDIAINERIARDLTVALQRNQKLATFEAAMATANLTETQRRTLREAIGWRHLDIVTIRPHDDLPGGPFGGFVWKPFRTKYLKAGKKAGEGALEQLMRSSSQTVAPSLRPD